MKGFLRNDPLLSLCGLNCGLCPMHIGKYCPGCGEGEGNQPCAIARCAGKQAGVEYCFQCGEYPCEKYVGADAYDSFVTHQNQLADSEKAQKIGLTAYHAEQTEKAEILARLLASYNDGRRKNFYCLAVNLLELDDLRSVMAQTQNESTFIGQNVKESAAAMAERLQAAADSRGILLKLRKKPPLAE